MRRLGINHTLSIMAALGAAALASGPSVEYPDGPGPGRRDHHKPGSNKPVPGGGAKERARRLARMMDKNPDGVTVPCDVCGLPVDPRADACHHCG